MVVFVNVHIIRMLVKEKHDVGVYLPWRMTFRRNPHFSILNDASSMMHLQPVLLGSAAGVTRVCLSREDVLYALRI